VINPWVILAIVIAWLASLVAVGVWQHDAGATAERTAWQQRETDELRAANAAINQLQDQARATERRHAQQMSALGQTHQKEIQHVEARRKADAAAARAGTVVLRDPGAARETTCPGAAAAPGAATGQRDGGQTGQLSGAAAEFLLDLANDADAVAEQLAVCQAVILSDRAAINQEGGDPR
jgi:hypothetical protein